MESKLFVGGLSRQISEDSLVEHFSVYGVVSSCLVARDRNTETPKGFGFVSFSDAACATRALKDTHVILGRKVEVKKANPKRQQQQLQYQEEINGLCEKTGNGKNINGGFRTKKIFVGGLPSTITIEEFKNYFEGYGKTTDVVVMYDSKTNRPRGFGFVTFESEEIVENVMENQNNRFVELYDKKVEIKRAVPKDYRSHYEGVERSPVVYNCYQAPYGHIYNGYCPHELVYSNANVFPYPTNLYNNGYFGNGVWPVASWYNYNMPCLLSYYNVYDGVQRFGFGGRQQDFGENLSLPQLVKGDTLSVLDNDVADD